MMAGKAFAEGCSHCSLNTRQQQREVIPFVPVLQMMVKQLPLVVT